MLKYQKVRQKPILYHVIFDTERQHSQLALKRIYPYPTVVVAKQNAHHGIHYRELSTVAETKCENTSKQDNQKIHNMQWILSTMLGGMLPDSKIKKTIALPQMKNWNNKCSTQN